MCNLAVKANKYGDFYSLKLHTSDCPTLLFLYFYNKTTSISPFQGKLTNPTTDSMLKNQTHPNTLSDTKQSSTATPLDSLSISSATSLNSENPTTATPSTQNNRSTTTTTTKPLVNYTDDIETRIKRACRRGFLDLDDKIRHLPEFERGSYSNDKQNFFIAYFLLLLTTHCCFFLFWIKK